MAISSNLANITNAIAAISVAGVSVRDVDEISATWKSRPNVLYPNPEAFLTNFSLEYQSFTHGALAQVDLSYTLNYRFCGTQAGDLSNLGTAYNDMMTKVVLIINAIITNHAPYDGVVSMELGSVTFGPVVDPAGNGYHGADLSFDITEMMNT